MIFMSLVLVTLGCNTTPPTETDLYIYLDFTEGQDYSHQLTEDLDSYAELLKVAENGSPNFGKVKIFPLYDLGSARGKTVKLKKGKSEFEANKFLRQKEVDKFKGELLTSLLEINEKYTGTALNNSHLIKPISKGMQKLNKSNADNKVVLIYSDMLENSPIANFHGKSSNTKDWQMRIDKACDPKDVSDLEIFVIYPVDKKNDGKITKAAEFWKDYFAAKGADDDTFRFETEIDL